MSPTCPECNGAGFVGGNGPVVGRRCEPCLGSGELAQPEPAALRTVPRLDERQFKRLFWEMQERRMRREVFGV